MIEMQESKKGVWVYNNIDGELTRVGFAMDVVLYKPMLNDFVLVVKPVTQNPPVNHDVPLRDANTLLSRAEQLSSEIEQKLLELKKLLSESK